MASLQQARNRYIDALQDRSSPTEKGRAKVLSRGGEDQPPQPLPHTASSKVAQRWQQKAQKKFQKEQRAQASPSASSIPRPFSMTAPPPPPPPGLSTSTIRRSASPAPSSSSSAAFSSSEPSPQIMSLRKQWNANKEIPRGKVTNSPFKPAPEAPSPQPGQQKKNRVAKRELPPAKLHDERSDSRNSNDQFDDDESPIQKRQWDAERDIPKGSVHAWKAPHEGSEALFPPRSPTKASKRPSDPWLREPDVKAVDSPKRQWEPSSEIPVGAVSKIKTNKFWSEEENVQTSPQLAQKKKQWDAAKDIPRGKVRGMSNLFDGKKAIPENHLEPVEPAEPSPPHSKMQILRPVAIQASRSEDSHGAVLLSPGEDSLFSHPNSLEKVSMSPVENDNINDFYMSGGELGSGDQDAIDADPWVVQPSSSNQFFGKGTWGEEVNASKSNDEFDDRDWFQSGSFGNDDDKKDPFKDGGGFGATPKLEELLEDSAHDSNDPIPGDNMGSFAAAIQPLRRNLAFQPETVEEETEIEDEESLPSAVAPLITPVLPPATVPPVEFSQTRTTPKSNIPPRSPARPPSSSETEANSIKLKLLLETKPKESPSDEGKTVSSKTSKSSKGSQRSLFRKKSEKKKGSDLPQSRVSGLLKLFSRKQTGNDDDGEDKKGAKISPKVVVKPVPEDSQLQVDDSLQKMTEDSEKIRSKGIISTRDDSTVISEMTNPTVFLGKTSSEEKPEPADNSNTSSQIQVQTSFQSTNELNFTPTTSSFTGVPDPFDVTSPLFSSGDPFQTQAREGSSLISQSSADGFTDPFFTDINDDQATFIGKSGIGINAVGGEGDTLMSEINNLQQQAVNAAPVLLEGDSRSFTGSLFSSANESDLTKSTGSPRQGSAIALTDALTLDTKSFNLDTPDPDIELLSSDDEAENDDPAIEKVMSPKSTTSSKQETLNDTLTSQDRSKKASLVSELEPILPPPLPPIRGRKANQHETTSSVVPSMPAVRSVSKSPARGMSRRQWNKRSATPEPAKRDDAKNHRSAVPSPLSALIKNNKAPKSPTRNRVPSFANLDSVVHKVESVDSGNLTEVMQNGSTNLSQKMRLKRYEKKVERGKIYGKDQSSTQIRKLLPKPPPEAVHVSSTSAYLSRFKGKGKVKSLPFEIKGQEPEGKALNTPSANDYAMRGSRFQSRALSQSFSSDGEKEAEAKTVAGSRSARRSMRFKTATPATASASGLKISKQETAFAYPVLVRTSLQKEAQPRVILRKSRPDVPLYRDSSPSSPFDIKKEKDPMHRAGLRLLALSVIPIQAEIRRFLAKREALNRMWAIIVIQSSIRRWLVLRQRDVEDTAALVIQTAFADYLTREYARVLIQAHVRRWLVQKRLLETFAVVQIQSQVRGWLVRTEYIEFRSAIRLQAVVRGWLIRTEYLEFLAARRIQKLVRGSIARLEFREYMSARRIQRVVRGNIARDAFQILRSAVRIQSATRGWIAYRDFWQKVLSAVQIQAAFRGWLARDYLEDQQYCATQIQRVFRGYLATMAVYEDIYKITLVQSFVRMKIAIDKATYRLAFVIQMQSIIRSYLVRRKVNVLNHSAVEIQKLWRGFSSRLNFQFDLVDIILVQNAYRRRAAKRQLAELKHKRDVKCATTIQARWRSYDCRMNYINVWADIIIVQSVSRSWLAARHVETIRQRTHFQASSRIQAAVRGFRIRNQMKRNQAATVIQTTWRGFVCYAEYMYTIADIVISQKMVRCWLARRKLKSLSDCRDTRAATKVQTQWRRLKAQTDWKRTLSHVVLCQSLARQHLARVKYLQKLLEEYSAEVIQRAWVAYLIRRDEYFAAQTIQKVGRGMMQRKQYIVKRNEHHSAIKIQSAWRGFWYFSNFIIILDSTILIQSMARSFIVRAGIRHQANNAIIIQSMVRSVSARRIASAKSMVSAICSSGSAFGGKDVDAARLIQTSVRGYFARLQLLRHLKARDIQSAWRSIAPRRALKQYRTAIRIQAWWRFICKYIIYRQYTGSRRIQAAWRGHKAFVDYTNYMAARKIQTSFRKSRDHLAYKRYRAAKIIQANWRCHEAREKYVQFLITIEAATMIQSAWRCFVCYTDYVFTHSDIVVVQRIARGYIQRQRYAALLDELARQEELARLHELCAIDIQRVHRGSVQRAQYRRTKCAITLQRVIRGHIARDKTNLIRKRLAEVMRCESAATAIQRIYRGYDKRSRYWYVLLCVIQIQCLARGYAQRLRFIDDIGGIIMAQAIIRRHFAIQRYKLHRNLNAAVAACKLKAFQENRAAKVLQQLHRHYVDSQTRTAAAIKMQSFFRMVRAMVAKEIKAEKLRRKRKKESKASVRTKDFDEALLEDAWEALSLSGNSIRGSQIAKLAAANQSARKVDRSSSVPRQGRQDLSSDRSKAKLRSRSRDSIIKHESVSFSGKAAETKKNMIPPSYLMDDDSWTTISEKPADMVRLRKRLMDETDGLSDVSILTTPSSVFRAPPSRLERMGKKAMTEDLDLEEAWVDMEIQNVKQKRRTTAKGKRHMTPRTTRGVDPKGKRIQPR